MPIILNKAAQPAGGGVKKSFLQRLKQGEVAPIISHEAVIDIALGSYQALVEGYADYIDYPLEDRGDLRRMARYRAVAGEEGGKLEEYDLKYDYLNYVKNHLYALAQKAGAEQDMLDEAEAQVDQLSASDFARRLGFPNLEGGPGNPLLVLADLGLPVYMTTSPHSFLEDALEKAGRQPRSDFCRWRPGLEQPSSPLAGGYVPSAAEPLVFHLFGSDEQPASLVLTEDDHLQFLVGLARGSGTNVDPAPPVVRQALASCAPMLLGFGLGSWAFRTLFWSMIQPPPRLHRPICSVQVVDNAAEKRFLQAYLERAVEFDVFWGDVKDYTSALHKDRQRA